MGDLYESLSDKPFKVAAEENAIPLAADCSLSVPVGAHAKEIFQHACHRRIYSPIFSGILKTFLVSKELTVFSLDFLPWYSAHTV